MDDRKKVALLMEAIRGHERGLLRGIGRYARTKGDWVFYLNKLDPFYRKDLSDNVVLIDQLLKWGVDGIITRYPEEFRLFKDKGIPVISAIEMEREKLFVNYLVIDNAEIGRMAARHLLERGFTEFGFCGFSEMFWSNQRCESFSKTIKEAGFNIYTYNQPKATKNSVWSVELKSIIEWLSSLPRPVAIMACNDDRAEHIIEGCKQCGLTVPEDVAIVGVDNDEFVCDFSDPPLSSIGISSEKSGFDLAELLDDLMNGRDIKEGSIVVKPTQVITRQSTDILAISDADVARAIAYMRLNSKKLIQVDDVAYHVGISLRVLQNKFRKSLGKSLRDELKAIRLNEITKLLRDTKMTVSQIAYALGYSSDHNLSRFFRSETGMSPMQYRRKYI